MSTSQLETEIQDNIADVQVTPGGKRRPTVLHSKKAGQTAVDHAVVDRDIKTDMKTIFQCSKVIRQVILQSRKDEQWSFEGSLVDCSLAGVPPELSNLIRWILQGARAATQRWSGAG